MWAIPTLCEARVETGMFKDRQLTSESAEIKIYPAYHAHRDNLLVTWRNRAEDRVSQECAHDISVAGVPFSLGCSPVILIRR